MRGFGATAGQNTLVLIDGRRLNDVDLSGVQWSTIPLEAIERIEILRGSGAVQYGDGASAGVINIITRHPAREGTRAAGSAQVGSFDTREVNVSMSAFGENAGVQAFARNYDSSGYRDNNQHRQSNFGVSGTWSAGSADASWRLSADRQGIRLPGARQVQPSAGIDQLASDRRGTSTPLDYAQRDGNQASVDLRWQAALGELALGLGYRDKAQRSYFDFGGFPDYRDIDLNVVHVQPRWRWRGTGWGAAHTVVTGLDVVRWDYTLARSNSPDNVWQPFNRIGARQHNEGVYLLDTVQVGERVVVNAGARYERQRIDASDEHDPSAPGGAFGSAAPGGSDDNHARAYELGVRWRVAPQTDLIARAGRSFRFANVDEIYETSAFFTQQFQFLEPQRATTYELGIALGGATPWLQASAFHMDVTDEIRLDPYSTGVGNRNMPPLERTGVETEVRRRLAESLELSGAYTYTRARFKEGTLPGSSFSQANVNLDGRTVPLVPSHKLDLALDWALTAFTRLRAEARYVSKQWMENDEGNTFERRIPSYTVADLKLQHRMGAFTATFLVANLFERKYYTYAVRSQFVADRFNAYPLPERTFWLGIAYNGS
jgi:iron complex outermembrane receptor protein